MKVFVADDNVPFRKGLCEILSDIEGITIVGEAGDVPGAVDAINRTRPDVVILDIHMPGGSGIEVAQAVKSSASRPLVIMLTVGPRSEYQTVSYLVGADYYFEKSSDMRKMTRMLNGFAREAEKSSARDRRSGRTN